MNHVHFARTALTGMLLWTAAASAASPDNVDRQARNWAASCAACHGTDGRTVGAEVPSLAGRGEESLFRALVEFRNGQRPAATVMHQHAKGYTEDELRRIARVFAAQPQR